MKNYKLTVTVVSAPESQKTSPQLWGSAPVTTYTVQTPTKELLLEIIADIRTIKDGFVQIGKDCLVNTRYVSAAHIEEIVEDD